MEKGFEITRDIKEMTRIFNELEDENGEILKRKNDYDIRAGQTSRPIATNDVKSAQILHAVMRCFDHFMKVSAHVMSESKSSINNGFLANAKDTLRETIRERTGQLWDMPNGSGQGGTTTTGKTAKKLLFDTVTRNCICSLMPEANQHVMRRYGMMLSIILQVMGSDKLVNVIKYKEFCTELNLFLLINFPRIKNKHLTGPWISITPSLHKVLAHSWELIEANEGRGLKRLDECGLEANNKVLRYLRTKLSRKCDEFSNITDVLQRMWLSSDPLIDVTRNKGNHIAKNVKFMDILKDIVATNLL